MAWGQQHLLYQLPKNGSIQWSKACLSPTGIVGDPTLYTPAILPIFNQYIISYSRTALATWLRDVVCNQGRTSAFVLGSRANHGPIINYYLLFLYYY